MNDQGFGTPKPQSTVSRLCGGFGRTTNAVVDPLLFGGFPDVLPCGGGRKALSSSGKCRVHSTRLPALDGCVLPLVLTCSSPTGVENSTRDRFIKLCADFHVVAPTERDGLSNVVKGQMPTVFEIMFLENAGAALATDKKLMTFSEELTCRKMVLEA